jgi:hypothetical protein
MRTAIGLCVLLSGTGTGAGAAAEEPVDVAAVKEKLQVLSDGKGHYFALVPFAISDEHFYFGDGKTMWAQRPVSGGKEGTKSWYRAFWEPRATAPYKASFEFRDGKHALQCEGRMTAFEPLPEAERRGFVDGVKFARPRWTHEAYALLRDNRGNYYFVDKVRDPASKAFRLWAGTKGKMKLQKMVNVVSDSEGDIFATKTGQLRLVVGKSEASWNVGKSLTKLVSLPVEDNLILIYTELGVYAGEPLGTPCDEL